MKANNKKMKEEREDQPFDDEGTTVTAMSNNGDSVVIRTSHELTKPFGFHSGQIVRFTKSRYNGKMARIVGVCEDGMLWFKFSTTVETPGQPPVFKDEVETTSCRGREEYIRQYGWQLFE